MSVEALIQRARTAGIQLAADGDRLRYRGPARALEQLAEELKSNKPQLIMALTVQSASQRVPDETEVSAHWLVLRPSGKPLEQYFAPAITRAQLARRFPGAGLIALPDTMEPPPPSAYSGRAL